MKPITETNVNFREVMISQLKQEYKAHRLKNEKAFMYKGKNQVEDIINAAKVSIC